jgi:hypothetical protein
MNATLAAMKVTEDMPAIITAPGEYVTRDGRKVTIHTVQDASSPYTFKAKGSIWRLFRGAMRPVGMMSGTSPGVSTW